MDAVFRIVVRILHLTAVLHHLGADQGVHLFLHDVKARAAIVLLAAQAFEGRQVRGLVAGDNNVVKIVVPVDVQAVEHQAPVVNRPPVLFHLVTTRPVEHHVVPNVGGCPESFGRKGNASRQSVSF